MYIYNKIILATVIIITFAITPLSSQTQSEFGLFNPITPQPPFSELPLVSLVDGGSFMIGDKIVLSSWNEITKSTVLYRGQISSSGTVTAWESSNDGPPANQHFQSVKNSTFVYAYEKYPYYRILYARILSDGSFGEWIETNAPQVGRGTPALTATESYVYAIGGYAGYNGSNLQSVEYAPINSDGSLGVWSTTSSTSTSHIFTPAFTFDSKIFVAGGGRHGYITDQIEVATIKADGSLSNWTSAGNMPMAMHAMGWTIVEDQVYFFGGYDQPNGGGITSNIYKATISGSQITDFQLVDNLPTSARTPFVGRYLNDIYIIDRYFDDLAVYAHLSSTIVYGCTDPTAINYNPDVTEDDGSCEYAPIADAGTGSVIYVGQTSLLDGSASSDEDGDTLTFTWTEDASNPVQGLLVDSSSSTNDIQFDVSGVYTFSLSVSDGTDSDEASVTVEVGSLSDFITDYEDIVPSVLTSRLTDLVEAIDSLSDPVNGESAAVSVSNKIDAVRNYIEAQEGKKVDSDIASILYTMLDAYQVAISGA